MIELSPRPYRPIDACAGNIKGGLMSTPNESQIDVLRAAQTREAGGNWAIRRSVGLDCIEHGWLTEDYYLTDLGKRIMEKLKR
jgi:hypothetical protein